MRPFTYILLLIAFAILLAVTSPAHAGFQYFDQEAKLGLVAYDEPCVIDLPIGVLFAAKVQGIDIEHLQRAEVATHEAAFNACWVEIEAGKVFIIDENGGFGFVKFGTGV
jgi:hypothetical protein